MYLITQNGTICYYYSYWTKLRWRNRQGKGFNPDHRSFSNWAETQDLYLTLFPIKHTAQGMCLCMCWDQKRKVSAKNKLIQGRLGFWSCGLICYLSVDAVAMGSINSQETWTKISGTCNLKMKHHIETLGQTRCWVLPKAVEQDFFGYKGYSTRIRYSFQGREAARVSVYLLCLV